MPRTRRFNTINNGFRSGQLSPASQDNVTEEVWQDGAARILNFRVERDGGLKSRPAFRRTAVVVPRPTHGVLVSPGADGPPPVLPLGAALSHAAAGVSITGDPFGTPEMVPVTLYTEDHPEGPPYGRQGGAAWIGRTFTTSASVAANADLLRITFPQPSRPSAITFHGVRLVSGNRTRITSKIARLNLGLWRGTDADDPTTGRYAHVREDDAAESETEGQHGAFSPGRIRRDIVVPLDGNLPGDATKPMLLSYVALRVLNAGEELTLEIGGVSCFGAEGTELPTGALERPVRAIPWPVRDLPFVLLLGMDHVAWVLLPRQRGEEPVARQEGSNLWHFTERQLRELTWSRFGGGLLLYHHDFPFPLHVQLPSNDPMDDRVLRIAPLEIANLPSLSAQAAVRTQPDVSVRGESVTLGEVDVRGRRAPVQPRQLGVIRLRDKTARVVWRSTGAESYEIDWRKRGDASYTMPRPTSTVSYLDLTGLTGETSYEVRVRSKVGTDTSAWSATFTFSTLATLTQPTGLTGTSPGTGTDGQIQLAWTAVPNAERYEMQWAEGAEGAYLPAQRVRVDGVTLTFDAVAGKTYRERVLAIKGVTRGPVSAEVTVAARNTPPATPTGLGETMVSQNDDSIDFVIHWDAVPGASGYVLQHRVRGTSSWTSLDVDEVGYRLTLSRDEHYEIRVIAKRAHADNSAPSAIMVV